MQQHDGFLGQGLSGITVPHGDMATSALQILSESSNP